MNSKPAQGADESIAAADVPLHETIARLKREHGLTDLAISFYDFEIRSRDDERQRVTVARRLSGAFRSFDRELELRRP